MKDWSTPASWRWNNCCNWPWSAVEFSVASGSLLMGLRRYLTRRWSSPEMKKMIASMIIIRRILGLILFSILTTGGGGGGDGGGGRTANGSERGYGEEDIPLMLS